MSGFDILDLRWQLLLPRIILKIRKPKKAILEIVFFLYTTRI
ncbi:MAG: hypothetical protein ACFFAU_04280 [Candidatus Hodarchaeota archaeon]